MRLRCRRRLRGAGNSPIFFSRGEQRLRFDEGASMYYSRVIRYSVLCASVALFAACSKEPASPPASSGSSTTSSAPSAPAPSTPPAASTSAPAAAGAQELASKSGCLACHAVDKKLVGPTYKEVAAKYAGQADAEAKLIQKVKNGGSGVWGSVPMPPNPQVSDQDVKTLVEWILSLK
jgi:cytochrome c